MNCNKNVILIFIVNTLAHLIVIKEKLLGTITQYEGNWKITPTPLLPSDKSKNKQSLLDNLERKWSLSICIVLLNMDIACIIGTYISNLGTKRVSGITFIRYTGSRKIGEPNDFRVSQNVIVVYSLEYKWYIYLRYASLPLISICNT